MNSRIVEPIVQLRVDHVDDVKSGTTNQFITKGGRRIVSYVDNT